LDRLYLLRRNSQTVNLSLTAVFVSGPEAFTILCLKTKDGDEIVATVKVQQGLRSTLKKWMLSS
jgi:hypothetical protein